MYIYVCILVLTCLFAALENKSRNLYLALFFVVFFLISALRADTVGYDLKNYIPLYNAISEMSWGGVFFFTDYELGYKLFNKLISCFSMDERCFFLCTSFVVLYGMFKYIWRFSKIFYLSLFLYVAFGFYSNTFNSIRSSLAIAIAVNSLLYINKKEKLKFSLVILLAMLFHTSAFFMFLAYPLSFLKINFRKAFLILLLSFVASFSVGSVIFSFAINHFFNEYADSDSTAISVGGGYNFAIFLTFILLGLYYKKEQQKNCKDSNMDLLLALLLIGTCMQYFSPHFSLFNRAALFFNIHLITLIPDFIDSYFRKKSSLRYFYVFITCVFMSFYMISQVYSIDVTKYQTNSQGTIPYLFYWENSSF